MGLRPGDGLGRLSDCFLSSSHSSAEQVFACAQLFALELYEHEQLLSRCVNRGDCSEGATR